jgi:SAM-dependent methyltransferase
VATFARDRPGTMMSQNKFDGQYYEVATPGSLSEKLMAVARDRIYADFLRLCEPNASDTILDVGVSDVVGDGANVIERRYPAQEKITAVGLGQGNAFKVSFPQIQYRQIVANQALPFGDASFDIVIANAVLEHVGSVENQRFFISELMRVGGRVYITVPHRFFPVEHHTAIPLLHWFDATFPLACRALGKQKWADSKNLILMTRRRLKDASPRDGAVEVGMTGIMLGPFSSNLYLFASAPRSRTI